MAIKAVFFDWFNTLARYEPARDESAHQVMREYGYEVTLDKVRQAMAGADKDWFEENARSPIRLRSVAEQAKAYARHHQLILLGAGINLSAKPELLAKIVTRMQSLSSAMHFVLFNDVVPALKSVRERKLAIGLLTNLDRDMAAMCRELGIGSYIDVTVTSGEIGVDKPDPRIFQAALKRANVAATEAVLVGDQYKNDILGARGVGMKGILIDRQDMLSDITDCPRLRTLTEVVNHLK
jgi:HAD superfamily hydrolase (TIGR01549 family)